MTKKEMFIEAHKMAKEIKKEYPEVDYNFQFSLCLAYLQEGKKEITWETVANAAEQAVEDLGYTDYYVNNWVKYGKDRSYIELRYYRKGKLKSTLACGYWDNIENKYVVEDTYKKNYNLLENK